MKLDCCDRYKKLYLYEKQKRKELELRMNKLEKEYDKMKNILINMNEIQENIIKTIDK